MLSDCCYFVGKSVHHAYQNVLQLIEDFGTNVCQLARMVEMMGQGKVESVRTHRPKKYCFVCDRSLSRCCGSCSEHIRLCSLVVEALFAADMNEK